MTNVTFDIAINNDDVYEGNENFMLTINLSTLPTGVTVGNPDQATVTIVDDDCKYFHYHLNYVLCYTVQHKHVQLKLCTTAQYFTKTIKDLVLYMHIYGTNRRQVQCNTHVTRTELCVAMRVHAQPRM